MINYNLGKGFAVLVTAVFAATLSASPVSGVNDISFVVGSGASRANLIIDFHDGQTKESFAWGYRFDGVKSGADMLLDIAAADANLTLVSGGTGADGFFLSAITYFDGTDLHSLSADWVNLPNKSWGYYLSGGFAGDDTPGTGGIPTPVSGGGSTLPVSWTTSPVGASTSSFGESGRLLSDGAWDSWSYGELDSGFNHQQPPSSTVSAAIPEPGTLISLFLGSVILAASLRRLRRFQA